MKYFLKYIASFLAFILVFSLASSCFASSYIWSVLEDESIQTNASVYEVNEGNLLSLEAGSAILIEQNTGTILYSHNVHQQLRPASVTKVMTILLIMEAIDSGKLSYTDKIPCTENAAKMGGSQIWLDVREELTVDEMLKAICVVSANDYNVQ